MLGVVGDHRHRGSVCARARAAAPPVVNTKTSKNIAVDEPMHEKGDIIPRLI